MSAALILDERLLGAIASPADPADLQLLPKLDMAAPLPARHLATLMPPVGSQGNTGRCVAFSSTGVKQWQERRDGHGFLPLDADWLYLHAGGTPDRLGGLTCRAALSVLLHTGIPLLGRPSTAGEFRIDAYYAVPMTEDAQKRAILQFGPLLIATGWWGNQFHPVNGFLPAPKGARQGGHARIRFGWDDTVQSPFARRRGVWYDRNSWGAWPGSVNGNSRDAFEFDGPMDLHDCWKSIDRVAA